MDILYRRPIYDPFEVFTPPKSLILNAIKSLKQQCYAQQNEIQKLKAFQEPILLGRSIHEHEQRLTRLSRLIKTYQARLKRYQKTGSYQMAEEQGNQKYITSHDLQLALGVPLLDFYPETTKAPRKSGQRYQALCPFHQEKTPSFVIYPDNRYHCFGCSEDGDVIDFVRKLHNLSFVEAVRYILKT